MDTVGGAGHNNPVVVPKCDGSGRKNRCIYTNMDGDQLHVYLGDADHVIFHSGMNQLGPDTDLNILQWSEGALDINGDFTANTVRSDDGVSVTQRLVTRIESGDPLKLIVYYKDVTSEGGIITAFSEEGSYEVSLTPAP